MAELTEQQLEQQMQVGGNPSSGVLDRAGRGGRPCSPTDS